MIVKLGYYGTRRVAGWHMDYVGNENDSILNLERILAVLDKHRLLMSSCGLIINGEYCKETIIGETFGKSEYITIRGVGLIYVLKNRKRHILGVYRDLVSVDVCRSSNIHHPGYSMIIETHSYCWAPFNINGESQLPIYVANLNRLNIALNEIASTHKRYFELDECLFSVYGFTANNAYTDFDSPTGMYDLTTTDSNDFNLGEGYSHSLIVTAQHKTHFCVIWPHSTCHSSLLLLRLSFICTQ